MALLTATTEVDRSAAEVFAYATDPSRFSEWQSGIVGGSMAGSGPVQVGDLFTTTRRVGPMTRPFTSKVEQIDVPRTWRVRGTDGPIRAAVNVRVEPLGDETSRLTITIEFHGHGIGRLLVPLVVEREARKQMPLDLAALKQRMETGVGTS
jgi:uncharacterized protein YndB with AHSA1/START domain